MPDPPPEPRRAHGQAVTAPPRGERGAPELELRHVHTYYGASHVLQGVSLTVQAGEVVALLGRNGVGKTTTVHSVIGFTPPRTGEVLFRGRPIHGLPPWRIARHGIGLVPQGRRIFPRLSVRENLCLAQRRPLEGSPPGGSPGGWDLPRVQALFPVLQERGAARAAALSGGEQQMVAIARALLTNPALLLLDEPSEGLAPIVVEQVGATLASLKGAGLSILLVEQYLPLALGVADRVYVMASRGQIVFHGTPAALEQRPDVYDDYLGV